jgi:hypothetical protein
MHCNLLGYLAHRRILNHRCWSSALERLKIVWIIVKQTLLDRIPAGDLPTIIVHQSYYSFIGAPFHDYSSRPNVQPYGPLLYQRRVSTPT